MNLAEERECKVLTKPTMHGLVKWERRMFKKLGWMVLSAKGYGLVKNVENYKCGLYRLLANIEDKRLSGVNGYKKYDLEIMKKNTECLINFVEMNINENPLYVSKSVDDGPTQNAISISTYSAENWFTCTFKKFGYMVLAKYKDGLNNTVNEYLKNIERLQLSLANLATLLDSSKDMYSKEKSYDIQNMLEKVVLLRHFTKKTLLESVMDGGKRKISGPTAKKSSKKSSRKVKKSSRKTSRK